MAVIENTFRQALDAGQPTIGTHFMFNDPDIAELIGDTGVFDYAEYVAEYSTFDMTRLYHIARAAQCGNLPLMIKLDQANETFWAQAALGAGFHSVLFTRRSHARGWSTAPCSRFAPTNRPPPGSAGIWGSRFDARRWRDYRGGDYDGSLDGVVNGDHDRKAGGGGGDRRGAVARAAALGVDMTQWGPSDYAFSF